MSALQIVAIILGVGITIVGWGLLARAVKHFVTLFKLGQSTPSGERTADPGARTATLLREFLGHTRMSRLPVVAVAHWVTMISFGVLFLTLVQATGQLFDPHFVIPFISTFFLYEWITELFAMTGIITILMLMAIRQKQHPRSAAGEDGRRSRFFGSTFWQAYYVELTILGVGICIALLRGMEYALMSNTGDTEHASLLHFPLTAWLGSLFTGMSVEALETGIVVVALIKLIISYAWMITISLTPTMGVAWHRFLAFFNIYFKRHADGRTSLGELQPMMVDGKPFTMESMEEMDEDSTFGVGQVEDFTWKGLLDFSTCTECGRCQDQCPAWNTEKPLSPKMMMMALRDHAHAKAPYLAAAEGVSGALPSAGGARSQTKTGAVALADAPTEADGSVATAEPDAINWGEMALIGQTGYDPEHPLTAYNPHGPDVVIDEDALWSCTTCGACVEQCPVDIEHVDHFVDMRRYQTLIASAFPSELGGLFKKLESKGNPWGMGAKARMDWAKDLPFSVKVFGEDVESADEVDYLFWVGCAGAYEDRAKKTTRAVAELFDHAGVDFAVLGNGETCTGDSARRAGNEVLFQMLAEQNVETLNDVGATKIVVTCAHCFNTIKNEYPQLGGKYEVVHHTQLLNRLVREKKIAPVNRPDGPRKSSLKDVASTGPSVTYHDPCYLGRHNNVYAPPRELISALPGVELKEMERTKEKSFCCGAGGARMWMEEKLGSRINLNRTEEAIATGADRIAVGCPFCRVMLSDGLTAKQSEGASDDIEVVDVAQMLLASIKKTEAGSDGQTESEEQSEAEPKTAVPAPTEGTEAKGATPAPPSGTETAKTAAAVEEAGEDPKSVEGQETVADKNSAPSWETDASTPAESTAPTNDSAAAKNAAPSWETDASAPAAPSAETPTTSEDSVAAKNAAPSWETGGTAAAGTGAAGATSSEDEAPAEETQAPPSEATEAPAAEETEEAPSVAAQAEETEEAPSVAAQAEETEEAPSVAAQAEAPATATDDSDLAAKNAAPSWESGTPAPAAPATESPAQESAPEAPVEEAPVEEAPQEQTAPEAEAPQDEDTPADQPEAETPKAEAPAAESDLAAKNAAPSWESGGAADTGGTADAGADAGATSSEDEAAEAPSAEATEAPAAEQSAAPSAPAAADESDLAAKNAAPSWESGTPAPAAPATESPAQESAPEAPVEEAPVEEAPQEQTAPEAEAPQEQTAPEAEAPQDEDAPADQPEAEAPAAEPAAPSSDDPHLSDLAKKNAKPSWE
ncbi:heterodisulfide reductase-related iron-sulfur binding cluster [Janibacter alittae]|uniref:Heterodisulfide reductase-related iron-sulfur binding cluster n=1 Tax=Janibacter alittae TaxID=3115209 RepID=A0ABZ2MFY9_9MICO